MVRPLARILLAIAALGALTHVPAALSAAPTPVLWALAGLAGLWSLGVASLALDAIRKAHADALEAIAR